MILILIDFPWFSLIFFDFPCFSKVFLCFPLVFHVFFDFPSFSFHLHCFPVIFKFVTRCTDRGRMYEQELTAEATALANDSGSKTKGMRTRTGRCAYEVAHTHTHTHRGGGGGRLHPTLIFPYFSNDFQWFAVLSPLPPPQPIPTGRG